MKHFCVYKLTNKYCLQIDAKLKQAAEKKQMLEQLKRVRKGKSSDLDFLEDKKDQRNPNQKGGHLSKKISKKRSHKDKKFGFGGKKKGSKLNTRDSTNQMDGFNSSAKKTPFNPKNNFKPKGKKNQRPGKSKRKNAKR